MENILTENNKPLKFGMAIKILSLVAFFCIVIQLLTSFFYYDFSDGIKFQFPSAQAIMFCLFNLSAVLIFIVYIFKFYSRRKANAWIPIVFALLLNDLELFFNFSAYGIGCKICGAITILALITAIITIFNELKRTFIFSMCICIFFWILAMMISFKYLSFIMEMISYINYNIVLIVSMVSYHIGTISLYTALLLFGSNNIPAIFKPKSEKADPATQLQLLKDKFDLGEISEEDYNEQRAQIINNI